MLGPLEDALAEPHTPGTVRTHLVKPVNFEALQRMLAALAT